MADYDSNLIKPVQSLQNIAGLAPSKRRKDRTPRRKSNEKGKEKDDPIEDEKTTSPQERAQGKIDRDDGGIDYCA
jgi:hypothetical protein